MFSFAQDAAAHQSPLLISGDQLVKELVDSHSLNILVELSFSILNLYLFCCKASHVRQPVVDKSTDERLVAPMQLCICFFD